MENYTQEELQIILDSHKLWVESDGEEGIQANLEGANLWRADLEGANLWGADLQRADLQRADLWRANLEGANLQRANLQRANLQRANLQRANLQRANLQRANLQRADLWRANLQKADLEGANLDFSCWPLWCGSIGVKADDRLVAQLAFHLSRLDIENCSNEVKEDIEVIRKLKIADKFCEYRSDVKVLD